MRIGVDLGGTKIEAVALTPEGEELVRKRVATPAGDYQGTVDAVASLIADLESDVGDTGSVGIGTPGSLSPSTGLMRNANSVVLNGQPLDRDLTAALDRPVRLANDANCFALSEAVDGAGAGHRTVFGVILGTGVGGGLVVDRQVLVGPNAVAGEWGHNPLPGEHEGRPCYCGRSDCVEVFLSGPAFESDYASTTGEERPAEEIVESTEPAATDLLERYVDRLARALAGVINIVDPDVIVLGGGMSNITALYEEVPRRWGRWVFSDAVHTPLVPNQHGDSSGVRGAAWLWPA